MQGRRADVERKKVRPGLNEVRNGDIEDAKRCYRRLNEGSSRCDRLRTQANGAEIARKRDQPLLVCRVLTARNRIQATDVASLHRAGGKDHTDTQPDQQPAFSESVLSGALHCCIRGWSIDRYRVKGIIC